MIVRIYPSSSMTMQIFYPSRQICVRVSTIRVVLESQVGGRSMPMLVLESTVDGEIVNPSAAVSLVVASFHTHTIPPAFLVVSS